MFPYVVACTRHRNRRSLVKTYSMNLHIFYNTFIQNLQYQTNSVQIITNVAIIHPCPPSISTNSKPTTTTNYRRSDQTQVSARKAFIDLATHFLTGKTDISVADFCCGTGNNTELLAQRITIRTATLIDINAEFGIKKSRTPNLGCARLRFVPDYTSILGADMLKRKPSFLSMGMVTVLRY